MLWFSLLLSKADTTHVKSETTQSEVSSSSDTGCAVGRMSFSQTVESSCAMIWYSFSRPGMESGGAHSRVTLLGVTREMARKRGAAGAVRGEDRQSIQVLSMY